MWHTLFLGHDYQKKDNLFHLLPEKLLYITKSKTPYIEPEGVLLTTGVAKSNVDDWNKHKRYGGQCYDNWGF